MDEKKRRNNDKWLYKAIQGIVLTFTSTAVGMTVYVFTNFATLKYVDAENVEQNDLYEERQKSIDQKLDFLVQNVGETKTRIEENRKRLEEEIRRDRNRREP